MPSEPQVRGIVRGAPLVAPSGLSHSRSTSRNKAELQRKARQRMATRRAELKMNDEAWAAYRAKAREDGARFRGRHAPDLALNQVTYRSRCVWSPQLPRFPTDLLSAANPLPRSATKLGGKAT